MYKRKKSWGKLGKQARTIFQSLSSLPLLALCPFSLSGHSFTQFIAQHFQPKAFSFEMKALGEGWIFSIHATLIYLCSFTFSTSRLFLIRQADFFAFSSVEFRRAYMASNSTRILRGEIGNQQSGHWFLDSPQSLPNDLTFSHNRPIQHWISNLSVIGVTHLEFLASIIFPFSRYGRLGIVVSCLAPRFTFINYCYRLAMRWPAVVKG